MQSYRSFNPISRFQGFPERGIITVQEHFVTGGYKIGNKETDTVFF